MNQKDTGKAFEYAVFNELKQIITNTSPKQKINSIQNEQYILAKKCFNKVKTEKEDIVSNYLLAANCAIKHIIALEPKLLYAVNDNDVLDILIQKDNKGQKGDVRDILTVRSKNQWEIGFSAKTNHEAVKHSRLSNTIDFGKKWLNVPNSPEYFNDIRSTFEHLKELQKMKIEWKHLYNETEMDKKATDIYLPIMSAFKEELEKLYHYNKEIIPSNLLKYLIGRQDFYKIINKKNKVEIQAYNFYGSLNKSVNKITPHIKIPKLEFPDTIIDISFDQDRNKKYKKNTIIVTLNKGWAISMRIHTASSKVEPSLKFDVSVVGMSPSLHKHTLLI
jgi:hypothetical protein